MKFNILLAIFCTTIFANDSYMQKGKIDMHGGKGDKIGGSFSSFFNNKKENKKQNSQNSNENIKFEETIELKQIDSLKDVSIKNK